MRSSTSAETVPTHTVGVRVSRQMIAPARRHFPPNWLIISPFPPTTRTKIGRARGPADRGSSVIFGFRLVALGTEQLHQHHEQVDEVQVEAQRAHDRLFAGDLGAVALVIHL